MACGIAIATSPSNGLIASIKSYSIGSHPASQGSMCTSGCVGVGVWVCVGVGVWVGGCVGVNVWMCAIVCTKVIALPTMHM